MSRLLRRTNWRKPVQFWKWRRTIPAFAKKFVSASALRPNSCLSSCPNSGHSCVDDKSESRREHFLNHSSRERRAPALWRRGEVQLDRLAAGARARLKGGLFGAGLEDLSEDPRRDLLGAVDADPGAEHPAARAVATRLVRCQSEALAHHASTLAAARRAVNPAAVARQTLQQRQAFPIKAAKGLLLLH